MITSVVRQKLKVAFIVMRKDIECIGRDVLAIKRLRAPDRTAVIAVYGVGEARWIGYRWNDQERVASNV